MVTDQVNKRQVGENQGGNKRRVGEVRR